MRIAYSCLLACKRIDCLVLLANLLAMLHTTKRPLGSFSNFILLVILKFSIVASFKQMASDRLPFLSALFDLGLQNSQMCGGIACKEL